MRAIVFVSLVATIYLHLPLDLARAWQGVSASELGGESVTVPFVQARHFMVVDVKVGPDDRTATKFLFDTGMNLTMLDVSLARDLQLTMLQEVPVTDSSGSAGKMGIYSLSEVHLGSVKVTKVIAGAIDFGTLSKQAGVPIAGILGDNFLRQFCIKIDYRQQTITFSNASPTQHGADVIKAAKRPQFAPIAIPITVDGEELEGIVDTGAHDIGLPVTLLERLDYPPSERLKSKGAMTGGLIGAGGQDMLVRIKALNVGHHVLERYPTFSVKNDKALLGYRFLSQFVVTIDYPRETAVLERYDDATFPHNVLHTGMALSKDEKGNVMVTGVWEGAAADALGIHVGDTVERIGHKRAGDYTQTDLSNLATDPACKEISLEMWNSGGARVVKLVKTNLFP